MEYTYNTTFITSRENESKLLDYIYKEIKNKLHLNESPAFNPELKKVMEAGGENSDDGDTCNIALSVSFENEEKAHLWHDHILLPALEDFHLQFGNDALFFITLLKNLPL